MVSAKRKRKPLIKELVCHKCDKSLDNNQIYCYECGEPTAVLRDNLSAVKTINRVWEQYKTGKGKNYAFSIFFFFVLLVPLSLIIIYTAADYYLHNLLLLLYLPLLMIPFPMLRDSSASSLSIGSYFRKLKHYFRYFVFVLLNLLFFFALKVITTSVDPILNIVRLVMVLYWIAIVLPLPSHLSDKKTNIFKSWWSVYNGGRETRWQQFYLYLFCVIINVLGAVLAGLGLLITIPFTFLLIDGYYKEMDSAELFDTAIPTANVEE